MDKPISNSKYNKTNNNIPGMESSSRAVIHSQKLQHTNLQIIERTRTKNLYDLKLIQDAKEFEKGILDTYRFNADFSIIQNSKEILHDMSCSQNSVKRSAYAMLRSSASLSRQEFTKKMQSRDLAHILNQRYIRDGLEQADWLIDAQIKRLDFHIDSQKSQVSKFSIFFQILRKNKKKISIYEKSRTFYKKSTN